jgi:5,10-methenyltetrahydrofolate synthetase
MIIVPINHKSDLDMPQESAMSRSRASLRAQLLRHRQGLTDSEHETRNAQMVVELLGWLRQHLPTDACIALYQAFKGEPDLTALADAWRAQGGTVLLPIVREKNTPLVFARDAGSEHLVQGAYGILEPRCAPQDWVVDPTGMDAVVIPCVGFTSEGFRLGYGGGYYDRTLAHWQAHGWDLPILIGVAHQEAQVTFAPESHDVAMNLICAV